MKALEMELPRQRDPLEQKLELLCPRHRRKLIHIIFGGTASPQNGLLVCTEACVYEIRRGIPRFVSRNNYAAAFGQQWQTYRKTQLDSFTGSSYSQERLERCLGAPLKSLKGKKVLECGAGAGRFTELLIGQCDSLVAVDISLAVEANLDNCEGRGDYLLCQADINASPLPHGFFDVVICLGVIQHTPWPEQTIANLALHLKPGGLLVIDHYTYTSTLNRIGQYLTLAVPLRTVLKRIARRQPYLALRLTSALTAVCDPIRRRTCRYPWLDRIASRLFPSACYYRTFPLLSPKTLYNWNELDTHDMLTDWFKHLRSKTEIEACLQGLGFEEMDVQLCGNGIEAHAYLSDAGSSSASIMEPSVAIEPALTGVA
jgi:2-polyprenyl-3-methyl-5-hydroxy-6-metoxy-1,4-benzoquinol methylase